MTYRRPAALTTILVLAATSPADGGIASFTPLGDFEGGNFSSTAKDVSDDGKVVVGSGQGEDNLPMGFYWTAASGLIATGQRSIEAVSADGYVALGQSGSTATRWTEAGGLEVLGRLHPLLRTFGADLSADGSIAAGYAYDHWPQPGGGLVERRYAVTWDAEGAPSVVWQPGRGQQYDQSQIDAITPDGDVIVGRDIGMDHFEYMRLSTGMMVDVDCNWIRAVSDDGAVLLGCGPYKWTLDGASEFLGDLPGGTSYGQALGMNADGSVIVGTSRTPNGDEAFIWDQARGMRNLKTVLETEHGLNLADWQLYYAEAMSPDGQHIVGMARNPQGNNEAYLVTIRNPLLCPGDADYDDHVDFDDLNLVLAAWGREEGQIGFIPEADVDQSGAIDFNDLNIVLANWGAAC